MSASWVSLSLLLLRYEQSSAAVAVGSDGSQLALAYAARRTARCTVTTAGGAREIGCVAAVYDPSVGTPPAGVFEAKLWRLLTLGCDEISNIEHTGQIALVKRGGCPFGMKGLRSQAAGFSAAVVVDSSDAVIPPGLGSDPVSIPMVMVAKEDGAA